MEKNCLSTYQKLCTEFYDQVEHPNHEAALDFYLEYARAANGPLLEPMCGSGRFFIPLFQEGLPIEGFDASESMLNALQKKASLITEKPPCIWKSFMQDFTSTRRYALIFIPYGSWGLITDPTTSAACLQLLHDHLMPGGKLVFEIETVASAPRMAGVLHHAQCKSTNNSTIVLKAVLDYDSGSQLFTSQSQYQRIHNGHIIETENELFKQYLYRFEEMDRMLATIGFSSIIKYQDHAKTTAHNPSTQLLIYECIK